MAVSQNRSPDSEPPLVRCTRSLASLLNTASVSAYCNPPEDLAIRPVSTSRTETARSMSMVTAFSPR